MYVECVANRIGEVDPGLRIDLPVTAILAEAWTHLLRSKGRIAETDKYYHWKVGEIVDSQLQLANWTCGCGERNEPWLADPANLCRKGQLSDSCEDGHGVHFTDQVAIELGHWLRMRNRPEDSAKLSDGGKNGDRQPNRRQARVHHLWAPTEMIMFIITSHPYKYFYTNTLTKLGVYMDHSITTVFLKTCSCFFSSTVKKVNDSECD